MAANKIEKPSSTRRRHTNSKLGCTNCKRKKIRCDENLPNCENCSRGKKEVCSYLSLSSSEINRIKITHSLRNSQNKLLNLNYRLPTSSNEKLDYPDEKSSSVLEFKFELTKLPLKIPSIPYPPVQFNNLTINDFDADFKVISSTPEPKTNLPNSTKGGSFSRLDYQRMNKKRVMDLPNVKVPPELNYHVVQAKYNLVDYLIDFINQLPHWARTNDYDLIWESLNTLSRVIILNQFKMKTQYQPDQILNLNEFEKTCFEKHAAAILKLTNESNNFTSDINYNHEKTHLNSYSCCFINFTSILLNFSIDTYYQTSKKLYEIFNNYSNYLQVNNLKPLKIFQFMVNNLQYNMMSINIPSYYPQFLIELSSNLENLSIIYKKQSTDQKFFNNDSLNKYYFKLNLQYNNLSNFIKFDIIPIIFDKRNESNISIYSPSIIYSILKKWLSIFPSEAMNFNENLVPMNQSIDGQFLSDLSITLYNYYHNISIILDTIFPSCKYLFSVSCMTPFTKLPPNIHYKNSNHENWFVPNSTTGYMRCNDYLIKHNYYIIRIGTFFQNRYKFYQNHVIWKNPYNKDLSSIRSKPRYMKNVLEIPIRLFNQTIIRPEHYPIRIHSHYDILLRDPKVNSIFTRVDENMDQNLYTSNLETIDFFNKNSSTDFDYNNNLLVKDYKPMETIQVPSEVDLQFKDLKSYYEDRTLIIKESL